MHHAELDTITKGDYSRLPVDEFRAFWHNLEFADSSDDDMQDDELERRILEELSRRGDAGSRP